MNDVVVFAEEPSGRIVAEALAFSLGIAKRSICIEHQGKTDLERSFPRKIYAWGTQKIPKFIIMRDNDGANCRSKKSELLRLVPASKLQQVKVRLVIQELESWYLGDPEALANAKLIDKRLVDNWSRKKKFRNPDMLNNAKQEFRKQVAERGQIELARLIGPLLNPTRNCSPSFHAFIGALHWAAN